MVTAKGVEEASRIIGDANGPFVWKDSYVFLMNLDGKMIAHPFQPELTKKDHVLLYTDPTDKALFVHFVNLAPDSEYFVGAGVYVGGMMY